MINFNLHPEISDDLNRLSKKIQKSIEIPYGKSDLITDLLGLSLINIESSEKLIIKKYKKGEIDV